MLRFMLSRGCEDTRMDVLFRGLCMWTAIMFSVVALSAEVLSQSISNVGSEFRIDTDVYVETSRPPIASTQTLFLQDRVVDWDDARRRMMRIDFQSQQIELADFENQQRCRIEIAQLASRLADLKAQLTEEQYAAWTATTEPVEQQGSFVLESSKLRYRFTTVVPAQSQMASAYAQFANLSVQVSAIYPPYKPPLLRMQLNDYLGQHSLLPNEIQLTDLRSTSRECITARILVQNHLTSQDRERVKDWDVLVQTLKLVSDNEFFQIERVARQRSGTTK